MTRHFENDPVALDELHRKATPSPAASIGLPACLGKASLLVRPSQ